VPGYRNQMQAILTCGRALNVGDVSGGGKAAADLLRFISIEQR